MNEIFKIKQECCGCRACENACPRGCIMMKRDAEGFLYPSVDEKNCVNCKICLSVCPFRAGRKKADVISTYAAAALSDEERFRSSSGAVFFLLAQEMIQHGGIVYGTSLSSDCRKAFVTSAGDLQSLDALLGSKYVQSDTGISYREVKKHLLSGRQILYSGTPCQIGGLKKYLGRDYENLLCADLICHGVPSPALWEKYVRSAEKKYHGTVTKVNFRCKDKGWKSFGIKVSVGRKGRYFPKEIDPYMQMFLKNDCLRPSCYACRIKGHSAADMTLGDFWGVEDVSPEFNDGKGTSLVILRTDKGKRWFDQISEFCRSQTCDYERAIKKNRAELHSVSAPPERETLFEDMDQMTFDQLSKKYLEPQWKRKLKMLRTVCFQRQHTLS